LNYIRNKETNFTDLGLIGYQEAWDYQVALFNKALAVKSANRDRAETDQQPTPNTLLFCEHPHVYTLGKSGNQNNLLIRDEFLKHIGATYVQTNRGGDITYHGPGQIVGYPILDLENFFTDIHLYMRKLEESVIETLAHYGIAAGRIAGLTGVWIDTDKGPRARKICAMGVKTSRWVTMHGLALNVTTDLNYFSHIVPCGIQDKAVTSMEKELGTKPDLTEVKMVLKEKIRAQFEMIFV